MQVFNENELLQTKINKSDEHYHDQTPWKMVRVVNNDGLWD